MDSSIIVISKFMELDVAGMCVLFKATNSILRNCCFCFVFTINYEHFQKKAMSPHSTTLAWKIPWMEAWWAAVHGVATGRFHFHFSLLCIGEGKGNTLQCSCLENPRDGGAWWAAVYGVAQSQTRLKRLSSSSMSIFIRALNVFPVNCLWIEN